MLIPSSLPRLKGYHFSREVVAYAVWSYHRFALSTADVEDLLAERGVIVSRETIRLWVNRFGSHFAACIRRDRPRPNDKRHMDEVVIPINGVKHWLWRAVDANGDTLDILVQKRRNAKAAKRFLARLIAEFGQPRVVITPFRDIASQCTAGQRTSCAATSSRSPARLQAPIIEPTKASITGSRAATDRRGGVRNPFHRLQANDYRAVHGAVQVPRQAQRFLAAHDQINTIFKPRRYRLTANSYRHARADAFSLWGDFACEMTA